MAMILSEDSSSPSSFRWVRPKSGHSLNCGGGALGYPEQFENSRYPRGNTPEFWESGVYRVVLTLLVEDQRNFQTPEADEVYMTRRLETYNYYSRVKHIPT
ncbi:hypothetical protein M8J77_020522 [Diaphorina citri]|nr:hypothetical protein M8J77_020522 [Diaphorina citri]